MNTIQEWLNAVNHSFDGLGIRIGAVLLDILGALLILIIGWFITKIVVWTLKKLLNLSKIDKLSENLGSSFKTKVKFNISDIIAGFVKWFLLLVFMIIAASIMKWDIVSQEMGNLLRYLPKLFSAIALLLIGLYVAGFIRKTLNSLFVSLDMSGGRIISSFIYYLFVIIIAITALNQANIQTNIITNNFTIFLGAFLLAFAISFGFGSKDVVHKLLLTFYSKKIYKTGDHITVNDIEGDIISIDNISITVQTKSGKVIIPIQEITENIVVVQSEDKRN